MPDLPIEHKWTAVTKGGFEITTVEAKDAFVAKLMAEKEMREPPLKQYFTMWAKDGYRMVDRGVV